MALPGNGIFVVRGEISTLMTAIKRGARWNTASYQEEEQDSLMKQFIDLKVLLINIEDLRLIDPNVFLAPFLDVIRSEETTGQITSLALSALNKFLSYGLIDPTHSTLPATVENIADAVTHARFVGSDQASDGVVLMKIVQVLRTLMLSPEGSALTNESVCEVMLSCFRICFEPRLNELLRRTAEHALKDIILLLFMRLPQFAEERNAAGLIKKLKMIASGGSGIEQTSKRRKPSKVSKQNASNKLLSNVSRNANIPVIKSDDAKDMGVIDSINACDEHHPSTPNQLLVAPKQSILATTPSTPVVGNIVDMQGKFMQTPHSGQDTKIFTEKPSIDNETDNRVVLADPLDSNVIGVPTIDTKLSNIISVSCQDSVENDADAEEDDDNGGKITLLSDQTKENNSLDASTIAKETVGNTTLIPYGLPCIRELLRFLISLCNPLDKQNTDAMIHMGLSLLTIALEVSADSIGKYTTLLEMVKDDLCKNVFALLSTERLTIFAADLQVCFLLFESQRNCLKFHLEFYLNKLAEIIGSENPRTPYEIRELALDNLLQFLRIPSFSAELYINYDCNLYCTNLLEDLVKLLSKNSLSATQAIYTIHQISLDGLLTIVADIERNCVNAKQAHGGQSTGSRHSRNNSNAEKVILETSDLNATTSGGEESSTIENIQNYISHKNDLKTSGMIDGSGELSNEHRTSIETITRDELMEIKNRKRILTQGTELFNQRPDKGIQFLQENNYLKHHLDPVEVAMFLRENSGLDKKMIGEYISKKKNVESKILETFVNSFDFRGMRIDLALRQYLETFRLPGEAPLIFLVMEHFADHWHTLNKEPFANTDAAFRLAYAIIMLNMDQHNYNAKRLNIPMTAEDFQKNLRGLNGNSDFDQDMLMEVFNSIKNEEIIMPAEQTGLVRENYLWKVLLRRNKAKDGKYINVNGNIHDKDIFQLVWGPTLAALSFMFDRSSDSTYHKSLIAFAKGAAISSHFMLHEDFNALILTLCKFTTLLNGLNGTSADGTSNALATSNNISNEITSSVQFGLNIKAQLAMKSVFAMVHKHGDCLRCDGWKNAIEVILQLFKMKLLPKCLTEVEDFCEPNGKIALILEKPLQKQDIGLFSSLYSYLSSDGQRQPTYEEQEIIKIAKRCVKECQLDQIIAESKFLHVDALRELIQCLLGWLKPPSVHKSEGIAYAEDTTVFLMEFLVKILIQNRDRLLPLWPDCRDQIYLLLLGSSSCGYNYLLVRTTVALLKLAIYLMRNEELCPVVLQSLKMLLMLKPNIILKISKQISTGMYELLKTSAQNIHTESDWDIVFTLLECVGAGAIPPDFEDSLALSQAYRGAKSDGALSSCDDESAIQLTARGYISDSEIPIRLSSDQTLASSHPTLSTTGTTSENWIIVNKDSEVTTVSSRPTSPIHSLIYPCKLMRHSTFALVKCWDSLAFIVRNVAHITPYNFESCVKCIRTFVEASLNGGNINMLHSNRKNNYNNGGRNTKPLNIRTAKKDLNSGGSNSNVNHSSGYSKLNDSDDDSDDDELIQRYETISIQLLDLMHTLHTRTAQIFRWWAEEGGSLPQCSALWALGWCPILQGIARLATDQRRQVRTSAVTCLQRALLVHDLQTLTGPEWESCFKQVLFPLLYDLLAVVPNNNIDVGLLEESRMRTATIMSKVFLHHLTPLISLTTFSELWIEILDYIEKFMNIGSDMLHEAMLESLKNMLLVMHSVRVFHTNDGLSHSPLWDITWNRVSQFLPHLKDELFDKEPIIATRKQTHSTQLKPKSDAVQLPNSEQIQHSTGIEYQSCLLAQQQPIQLHTTSEEQATSKTSIILQPPENNLVNQNTPLLVQVLPQSNDQIPLLVSTSNSNIYHTQIQQSYSIDPMAWREQSNIISAQSIAAPAETQSQNYNRLSESIGQQLSNNYALNGPYINPDFSNIIELPITPSPPTILEVDENIDNINDDETVAATSHNPNTDQPEPLQSKPTTNTTIAAEEEILPAATTIPPPIPLSHLITSNQYPSLNKIPPANIAQSFAPMYIQPQAQQQQTIEGDIYSDYVNNPYNLTLQQNYNGDDFQQTTSDNMVNRLSSTEQQMTGVTTTATPTPVTSNLNVFQSMNYFSSTDTTIPPGSEMLFGGP